MILAHDATFVEATLRGARIAEKVQAWLQLRINPVVFAWMRLDDIDPIDRDNVLCRIVVETPRGSRHKYAFAYELGGFVLKKSLPEGMVFPFDFGFIPQTKGGDGDPVDALVLADGPIFPGCIVPCRIIGLIEAKQRQEDGATVRNDRFVAVAECSEQFRDVRKPADLPPHILEQTEQFFVRYNEMAGKKFKPLRVLGPLQSQRKLEALVRAHGHNNASK
jgi:inorganic pyrophosphatase